MARRTLPAAVLLAIAVGVTACTGGPAGTARSATPTSATPAPSSTVAPIAAPAAPLTLPGGAQANSAGAWQALLQFVTTHSVQPAVVLTRDYATEDFAASARGMTGAFATRWDTAVTSAVGGDDPQAWALLRSVVVCDISEPGHRLALPESGDVAVDRRILVPSVEDDVSGLLFTFTYQFTLRLTVDGAPRRFPVEERLTYRMVSSTPWSPAASDDTDPSHWSVDEVIAPAVDVLADPQTDAA